MCLPSVTATRLNFSISNVSSFESRRGFCSASTGRNPTFPHFLNVKKTSSFIFPLHLRFAETCYTKFWRFYQVSIIFPERKCQVMFHVSGRFRCCSFPLYFCNGFLISSLNLCDEKKPIMVLCMVFTILTKFKRQEIALIYQ